MRREISGRCLRLGCIGLLDLLMADKKDTASDNESYFVVNKHIWLCEMFLEEGTDGRSIARHYHSCKFPLYNTFVIESSFVVVHSATQFTLNQSS